MSGPATQIVAASWRANGINRITGQIDKMGIKKSQTYCALPGQATTATSSSFIEFRVSQ